MTLLLLTALTALAGDPPTKVRYRAAKEIDFENMLIHGQLQKPELGIVTGITAQSQDGLLRLRNDFLDRMSEDLGEEVTP